MNYDKIDGYVQFLDINKELLVNLYFEILTRYVEKLFGNIYLRTFKDIYLNVFPSCNSLLVGTFLSVSLAPGVGRDVADSKSSGI